MPRILGLITLQQAQKWKVLSEKSRNFLLLMPSFTSAFIFICAYANQSFILFHTTMSVLCKTAETFVNQDFIDILLIHYVDFISI